MRPFAVIKSPVIHFPKVITLCIRDGGIKNTHTELKDILTFDKSPTTRHGHKNKCFSLYRNKSKKNSDIQIQRIDGLNLQRGTVVHHVLNEEEVREIISLGSIK